jgi:serine O-acetyltransferase
LSRTFHLIGGDLRAKARWCYGDESRRAVLRAFLADGTFAMVVYRLMQGSRRAGLAPLEMLFNKINTIFGACIIGRGAEFGEEFVLIHSQGVVINGSVVGGDRVYIEHQVTVGAERGASPVLGSDLFIGAGAKVIGAVSIGDGARIGANAVVTKDVPAGATAVGVPARIIAAADDGGSAAEAAAEIGSETETDGSGSAPDSVAEIETETDDSDSGPDSVAEIEAETAADVESDRQTNADAQSVGNDT